AEVVIVSLDLVRHEELRRIKACEGGKAKRIIRRLPKILIAQAQRQRQLLRRLPRVLEEVTLAEQVRLVERRAEVNVRVAAAATEVVNEISKARVGDSAGPERIRCRPGLEGERAALVEGRALLGGLLQELRAEAERVRVPNLRHRVLEEVVLGDAELRQVRRETDGRKATTAGEADIGQRARRV